MLYNFDTPSYINSYRLITDNCKSDVLENRDKDMFHHLDKIKFF